MSVISSTCAWDTWNIAQLWLGHHRHQWPLASHRPQHSRNINRYRVMSLVCKSDFTLILRLIFNALSMTLLFIGFWDPSLQSRINFRVLLSLRGTGVSAGKGHERFSALGILTSQPITSWKAFHTGSFHGPRTLTLSPNPMFLGILTHPCMVWPSLFPVATQVPAVLPVGACGWHGGLCYHVKLLRDGLHLLFEYLSYLLLYHIFQKPSNASLDTWFVETACRAWV